MIPLGELKAITEGLEEFLTSIRISQARGRVVDVDTLTQSLLAPEHLTDTHHRQVLAASLAIACLRLVKAETR